MTIFTLKEAAKRVGCPAWNIRNWLEWGHIVPSVLKAYGRGSRNLYSVTDLQKMKKLYRLQRKMAALRQEMREQ